MPSTSSCSGQRPVVGQSLCRARPVVASGRASTTACSRYAVVPMSKQCADPHLYAKAGLMLATALSVVGFWATFFAKAFLLSAGCGVVGAVNVGLMLYHKKYGKGEDLEKVNVGLKQTQKKMASTLSAHRSTNSQLSGTNEHLMRANAQLQNEKRALTAQVEAQLRTIEEGRGNLARQLGELQTAQRELKGVRSECVGLRADSEAAERSLEAFRQALGKSGGVGELAHVRLQEANTRLERVHALVTSRTRHAEDLERTIEHRAKELDSVSSRLATLAKEQAEKEGNVADVQRRLTEAQRTLREITERIQKARDAAAAHPDQGLDTSWVDVTLEALRRPL